MSPSKPEKMDEAKIRDIAKDAVTDAVDFVESEIARQRIKAQRYYDGEVDIGHEDGRSKCVKTVIRDTVRAIKPSLMRVFLQAGKPVEYVPRGPEDVQMAQQATEYAHYQFYECDGYRVLNDAIHDALIKKSGIVKVWWDETEHREYREFDGLTGEEYSTLMIEVDNGNFEIIEVTEEEEYGVTADGIEQSLILYNVKGEFISTKGKLRFDSVPPEEFFVDRNARNRDNAYVVSHRTEVRVGELVEMGYDFDDVFDLTDLDSNETTSDEERFERRGYEDDYTYRETQDPSMKLVGYTEVYMKIDIDGTGVPALHKICLGGGDYQYLSHERVDHIPFAVFEIDPEPHAFYGNSIPDLLFNDQDSATAAWRGILDNIALVNNPRHEVVDRSVNMDDMLNNEIGGIVRVEQAGSISLLAVPFMAGETLPAMAYMDQEIENKTGVTKASTGLSPDALQSTTAAAVNATVSAQAGQIEVMARNLAEGGMRQLFTIMLQLIVENADEEVMMRLTGDSFAFVNPKSWNPTMDVSVNVGLGTGKEEQKMAALTMAYQEQKSIYQMYGPNNGMVNLTQIRNAIADVLHLNGVRNAERYFSPMTPEIEQQLITQAQQAQPQQKDPYVQGEEIKAQTRAQVDITKAQMSNQQKMAAMQLDLLKLTKNDDLARDKMTQDMIIEAARLLGELGISLDTNRIRAMQNEQPATGF